MKKMRDNRDDYWEIIAGKLHGELSPDEQAEFNRMMIDSSDLLEFTKAQQMHDNLAKTGLITESKAKSWARVEKGIRSYQLRWIKVVMKYAAVVVVAFILGNLIKPLANLTGSKNESGLGYSEIFVPFGQMSQLTLSDGTKVWLNSGTTIRYPEQFAEDRRVISVEGEAFFEVAKLPHKPFTVSTADMKVEVLGTSFNLSAYGEDAASTVTLVEGKVELQNPEGKAVAFLSPGEMAIKRKNQDEAVIEKVNTSFYSTWIAGKIFFDDEPLDKIAVKLERWFNVEIVFADEQLKSYRFTGTILKNKPVDQIMQALEILAPISFKHQVNINGKDKITIYKTKRMKE